MAAAPGSSTLSLHDALPIFAVMSGKGETVLAQVAADSREVLGCNTRADLAEVDRILREWKDRKSTRLNSSHRCISYAVFCLKRKTGCLRSRFAPSTPTAPAG